MLRQLHIQNYALIEQLDIDFESGFSVITGETGAGKSILLGALSLILGSRADSNAIRSGAKRCTAEATFDISGLNLQAFFDKNELDYDNECIIRRELTDAGKSRAFINDTPVSLAILKELSTTLLDIHSQHQNLLLGDDKFQLSVVDALAHNQYEAGQFRTLYTQLIAIHRRIAQLRDEAERNAQEADFIRYQFTQLDDANLQEDEQEELEAEQELLSHAEDIKSGLYEIYNGLDGEESLVQTLKSLSHKAQELSRIYPEIAEIAERLESDFIDLKDIAEDVEGKAEDVNFDPQRFEQVEERLSQLYSLFKKHGVKEYCLASERSSFLVLK